MTYTEMHANFCEQQITVRKVLVHSDTLDTRLEKVCPSLPTMSRSSSSDNVAIYKDLNIDIATRTIPKHRYCYTYNIQARKCASQSMAFSIQKAN